MHFIQGLICAAAAVVFAASALARPLDEVKESGKIVFAVYDDFAPYSYLKDGKPDGIDVAIGKALAAKLGLTPEFEVRVAGENIEADLRANIWRGPLTGGRIVDAMLHVPAAKELNLRDEFVFAIGRYFSEHVVLLVDPSQVGTSETLALFASYKIGVELDTLADLHLSSPFTADGRIAPNVTRYLNFNAAIEGLKKGEVAGLLGPRGQLEVAAAQAGREVKIVRPPMPGLEISAWDLGIAVKTDSRDLGYALADSLTEMRKSGALAKIFKQYGLTYHADFQD